MDTLPGNIENKGREALIPETQISASTGVHWFSYRCVGVLRGQPHTGWGLGEGKTYRGLFKKMDPVESKVSIHKATKIKSKCGGRRERERDQLASSSYMCKSGDWLTIKLFFKCQGLTRPMVVCLQSQYLGSRDKRIKSLRPAWNSCKQIKQNKKSP